MNSTGNGLRLKLKPFKIMLYTETDKPDHQPPSLNISNNKGVVRRTRNANVDSQGNIVSPSVKRVQEEDAGEGE